MLSRLLQVGIVAVAAAGAVGLCAGWTQPAQGPGPRGLVKVQQGVADAGPLSRDLRIQPLDLRAPKDFDAVYRGRTVNPVGPSSEFFARIDGGVTAVFPQSIYTDAGQGRRTAAVPPGTVFYIGALPPELMGGADAASGFDGSGLTSPARVEPRPPTVVGSGPDSLTELPFNAKLEGMAEGRRAERAAALLHQAAEAEEAMRAR